MNVSRSVWMGIGAAIILFLSTLGLAWLLNFDLFSREGVSLTVRYVLLVKTIIIAVLFSFWYFQDENIFPTFKEGSIFGIIVTGSSIVFDFTFSFIYAMILYDFSGFMTYYLEWTVWVSYPLLYIAGIAVAAMVSLSRGEEDYLTTRKDLPKKTKPKFDETKDGRPKKLVGLVLFAWGLSLVSFAGSFRVVGIIFILSSVYLLMRASRERKLASILLGINALLWSALQIVLVFFDYYASLSTTILQKYVTLSIINLGVSLLILGWFAFSKKR